MYCIKCGKETSNESCICDECAKVDAAPQEEVNTEQPIEQKVETEIIVEENKPDEKVESEEINEAVEETIETINDEPEEEPKHSKKKNKKVVNKEPKPRPSALRSSIIGLVSGCVGLLCSFFVMPGYIFGILGIIESSFGLYDTIKSQQKGKTFIIPLVCSICGIVLSLFAIIWVTILVIGVIIFIISGKAIGIFDVIISY